MSHFSFLKTDFPVVHEAAVQAENSATSNPRIAAILARRALELAVNWAFKHDKNLSLPHNDNLSALIHEPSFISLAGQNVLTKCKIIKKIGNLAAHSEDQIKEVYAIRSLRELCDVTYWFARTYAKSGVPTPLSFNSDNLPKPTGKLINMAIKKLESLQKEIANKDEKISQITDELKEKHAEVARAKAANAKVPDTYNYNESETRDYFIDLLLSEAGWPLDQAHDREYEVTGMPNESGTGYVDYVLWGDNGKPLAVVEAKRTKRDPKVGKNQAKLYADCLEEESGQRPIIFYTNGYEHYIWDDLMYPSRPIQGFFKKEELELLIQRRTSRQLLNSDDAKTVIAGRPYQKRAIQRIVESFQNDNRRKALLVMATGTGKTRTIIALADLLMEKNWAKRVLFLADRVALVNQAVNAFKEHLPSASVVNLVKEKTDEGRVYVSTYNTMMGLIDGKSDDTRKFGVGHFDLIVIDEAHRSIYRKYRAIFDYFDSYLVGLTATPREEIDRNTYGLFDLEDGIPTDAYTLDEAIEEGWLVPPVPISVPLKFQREGIKYDDLSEDEKDQWDAIDWSDDGTKPDEVSSDAVNRWLFNEDTVDKVIANVMQDGIKVGGGDKLGKTIIFAKNQPHAEFILGRFDANYPHLKGHFASVITFKTEYAQNLIDNFSISTKDPHIAVSVDMLDTGIDVPEVVNLVLFKVIRSKTKFWQILGRGTRLCPDLFGPGDDKSEFFIFDYCQNFEYFSVELETNDTPAPLTLTQRLFQSRLELIQSLDDENNLEPLIKEIPADSSLIEQKSVKDIRQSTAKELLTTVQEMDPDNFMVRAKRIYVEKYRNEGAWAEVDDDMITEVVENVAPLPSSHGDPDEMAKRFDLLILSLQLCILRANDGFDRYARKVTSIAQALIDRQEVPAIKPRVPLLLEILEEQFWQDITVPILEVVRVRLRDLVKLIDKESRDIVYTDFEDELGEASVVSVTDATERSLVKFRAKARAFLNENLDHISLNKLRMNQPLTPTDISELERFLKEAGLGEEEVLEKAVDQSNGIGSFVRSLIGLDKSAAQAAFSAFTEGKKYNSDQLEYIKLIIDYLTERGAVPTNVLYESPFTNAAPQGPDGIFENEDVENIIKILNTIDKNAILKSSTA